MGDDPTECAFCDWLVADSQTRVYEDENVFAEVDPRQPHRGHVLVMPRRHIENVFELDPGAASAVMTTTVRVARAVRSAFEPDGLSLWQSNGRGAHQEVPHFHMHVMPRWAGDGLLRVYPHPVETPEVAIRAAMATDIRAHLA
jgi:histidine triad (HIT) family protein